MTLPICLGCRLQLVVRPPEVALSMNVQAVEHAVHVRVYRKRLEPEREQQDAVDALGTQSLDIAELGAGRIEAYLTEVIEVIGTSLLVHSTERLLDPPRLHSL